MSLADSVMQVVKEMEEKTWVCKDTHLADGIANQIMTHAFRYYAGRLRKAVERAEQEAAIDAHLGGGL